MRILPVSIVIFYEWKDCVLKVWTQKRTDDGPWHGFWEFPGGGVESAERPIDAAVREVHEEVGIEISHKDLHLMGLYPVSLTSKTVMLYVFLHPVIEALPQGMWIEVDEVTKVDLYQDKIPTPNVQMIKDLFNHFVENGRL